MTLTPHQIARHGWRPDLPDPRDRSYNCEAKILQAHQLPGKFSIPRNLLPKIFNQLNLGSCTANAIVRALMAAGMKQGEAELMLSRLFVYYCERVMEGTVSQDAGAAIRDGIKAVANIGAPPESEWPYDISKFAEKPPVKAFTDAAGHEAIEYHRIDPRGPGAPLRTALYAGLPVIFGFVVPEKFEDGSWDPSSEPLPPPSPGEGFIGGHAVCATGWDFSGPRPWFEIDNSWGSAWGIEGRFRMDAQWLWRSDLSSDMWVVSRVK